MRVWFLLIVLVWSALAHATDRPNLLLIMTDNQSPSLLGAYGNRQILTPNIDRLAREGLLFERAYAGSGVCSPSRAVLLTGLMPSQNGVHNGLPGRYSVADYSAIEEFRNLPQTLADAGYVTGLIGKYHLGAHEKPQLGFSFWTTFRGGHTSSFHDAVVFDNGRSFNVLDLDEHLTDFWSRRAVDFLEQQARADKPFFLWLSYNGPYILPPTVNEPPNTRHAAYYTEHTPTPPQWPVHPYLREWVKASPSPAPEHVPGGTYPWAGIDALNNPRAMINVASETTMVDDGIGKVLAALDRLGLADNTVVVFLSDQGSAYGQLGLWGNSSWGEPPPAYNANMQVPMIVRHPGHIAAGTTNDAMINQFDVLPTLIDYLGLGDLPVANSPGRSFAAMLRGQTVADWPNEVFFEFVTTRVVQTPRWKYTKRFLAAPNELYDMVADPGETQNLIDRPEYAGTVAMLDRRLSSFWDKYSDSTFDVWRGGTGKSLVFYGDENQRFRDRFPGWREPFVVKASAFRDQR